jgi:hypothetical protein
MWRAGILIGVLLGGCGLFSRDLFSREAGPAMWSDRGHTVGNLAGLYCVQGSEHERAIMYQTLNATSHPAKVTIECPTKEGGR